MLQPSCYYNLPTYLDYNKASVKIIVVMNRKKNIILILQLLNLSGQFKVDRKPLYKLLVNVK